MDATTAYQRGFADGDAQARQNVAEWVRDNPDSMDAWADANRQATAQRLAPVGDDAVEDVGDGVDTVAEHDLVVAGGLADPAERQPRQLGDGADHPPERRPPAQQSQDFGVLLAE